VSDAEIDRTIDEAATPSRPLEPVFEQFFKKLAQKAKGLVKKVASVAKKGIALAQKLSPIHLLLGKLKGLVRPLLQRVLKMALDKLPPAVRPMASKLAKHLLAPARMEAEAEIESEATADVSLIQRELDERMVNLAFTGENGDRELMLFEAWAEAEETELEASGLDSARAQFVSEIARVEPHEAGPVIERFIPAILPALKLGIKLIGRPRVVSTLAKLVAQLIQRFVGKGAAPALSRALVDTGMRTMSLESADQETTAGANAIAATVEDVVRRVSEAEDEVLDDSRLLEAEVVDAFARAAAGHFPQEMLSEDRRESSTAGGTWVPFPKGGFKKYTRVFEVEITPDLAKSIQTFGGTTLDAFIKDRLQFKLPVRARVHLYEAVRGTWLSKIARSERGVAGLGAGAKGAWRMFHPLTKQSATALLREPGLGRDLSGKFTSARHTLAIGQRVFYLELPGAAAVRSVGREGRVDVVADFPKNELRLAVYLSEREAQAVASRLNGGAGIPAIISGLKEQIASGVRAAMSGNLRGRIKIIHEAVDQEGFLGAALKRVSGSMLGRLGDKVTEWALKAVADELQRKAAAFVAATQDPADGVTIRITLGNPPGFAAVRAALKGKGISLGSLGGLFKGSPTPSVQVVPGLA
jgi:hypothetical protein